MPLKRVNQMLFMFLSLLLAMAMSSPIDDSRVDKAVGGKESADVLDNEIKPDKQNEIPDISSGGKAAPSNNKFDKQIEIPAPPPVNKNIDEIQGTDEKGTDEKGTESTNIETERKPVPSEKPNMDSAFPTATSEQNKSTTTEAIELSKGTKKSDKETKVSLPQSGDNQLISEENDSTPDVPKKEGDSDSQKPPLPNVVPDNKSEGMQSEQDGKNKDHQTGNLDNTSEKSEHGRNKSKGSQEVHDPESEKQFKQDSELQKVNKGDSQPDVMNGNSAGKDNTLKATENDKTLGKQDSNLGNGQIKGIETQDSHLKDAIRKNDSSKSGEINLQVAPEENKNQNPSGEEEGKKSSIISTTVTEQYNSDVPKSSEKKDQKKQNKSKNNQSKNSSVTIKNSSKPSTSSTSISPLLNPDNIDSPSGKGVDGDEFIEVETNNNNDVELPNSETNPNPGSAQNSEEKTGDDDIVKAIVKPQASKTAEPYPEEKDNHFFPYFVTGIFIFAVGYLVVHNKQKILGLIVEGRTGRARRRSHAYKRLENEGAKFSQIY